MANSISKQTNKLPDYVLKKLETQLKENLIFFDSIPTVHYQKFIEDGVAIINGGLSIDNVFATNFLYTKNGFYYIDLDGFNEKRAITPVSNIFKATIDNVCDKVYTFAQGYSEDIAKQQLDLCLKLCEAINSSCKNPDVQKMFNEYNSGNNALKRLYNGAIGNVRDSVALEYKEKMQNLTSNAKEMC